MPIYHSVTELIGRTPLLELCNYERNHDLKAVLLAKLECMNPAGSAKDRVAANMIARAETEGRLAPGGTIIEHRYRSGCRSCGKGLPCDSHHAGHHERGAPGSDRRLRRGDYPDAGSGGHGGCCGQGGRTASVHSRQHHRRTV